MGFVINLYKPSGITSQQAVTQIKKIFVEKKAGHAGTLDPLAEGVLLVCVGEATKITGFLASLNKEYVATLKLGAKTDTFDAEGEIIKTKDASHIKINDMQRTIVNFLGKVKQLPPMYSAVKHEGVPLYRLARKGVSVERSTREIIILSIELLHFDNPFATLKITCSKGTYIRALVNDIGESLDVGAHLVKLIRTKIGKFHVKDAINPSSKEISKKIITIDEALYDLEEIILKREAYMKARNGVSVAASDVSIENVNILANPYRSGFFRLKGPDRKVFAIGRIEKGFIRIERKILTKVKEVF
jgi:tRNA pseudouridine55 synthase